MDGRGVLGFSCGLYFSILWRETLVACGGASSTAKTTKSALFFFRLPFLLHVHVRDMPPTRCRRYLNELGMRAIKGLKSEIYPE